MRKGYRRDSRPRRKIVNFLFGSVYLFNDVSPVVVTGVYQTFKKYLPITYMVELQELYYEFTGVSTTVSRYLEDYKTRLIRLDQNNKIRIYLERYNLTDDIWLVIAPDDGVIIEKL